MKIAVITDDLETISAHFGRAQHYKIFTIEDGNILQVETRSKANHTQFVGDGHEHDHHSGDHGMGHAAGQRHNLMMDPIMDCQVLLARGMGMGARNGLQSRNIEVFLTEIREIENAVNAYLAGELVDHPERLH